MTLGKQKLLKLQEGQQILGGPIFDFGPGWGTKTTKWFKKYIFGPKCTLCRATRYILLFGAMLLVFGGPQLRQFINDKKPDTLTGQIKITEVVRPGDSKIKLARRALADYLYQHPDATLTNGQKVNVETVLGQKIISKDFRTGNDIEFSADDIKSAIEKSKTLTPYQLQRWEDADKSVKF